MREHPNVWSKVSCPERLSVSGPPALHGQRQVVVAGPLAVARAGHRVLARHMRAAHRAVARKFADPRCVDVKAQARQTGNHLLGALDAPPTQATRSPSTTATPRRAEENSSAKIFISDAAFRLVHGFDFYGAEISNFQFPIFNLQLTNDQWLLPIDYLSALLR